jgi:hypothetical protein
VAVAVVSGMVEAAVAVAVVISRGSRGFRQENDLAVVVDKWKAGSGKHNKRGKVKK